MVDGDYIGRRVDKYLRDNFGYLQSAICVLSKQKKILINNRACLFNYRLQKGDVVEILDERWATMNKNINDSKKHLPQRRTGLPIEMIYKLRQAIVLDNADVLVINKPYGLSVQGGTGVKYSLEDFFSYLYEGKLRIVHRIDKDTRGLLILAKNLSTAIQLTEMFKTRQVKKKYLAVLAGIPNKNQGTIKTSIVLSNNDNIARNAVSMEDRLNGKPAVTKYKVLKINKENNTSLVEFYPLTGRKHQIRLHAQYIKCPIVGDEKYGFGKQKNKKLQLFATVIDASPIVKIELSQKDLHNMINF